VIDLLLPGVWLGSQWQPGKPRVLPELSSTIAAIGRHGVKPVAHPHFANLLLHLFAAAKLDQCGPLRFFPRVFPRSAFRGASESPGPDRCRDGQRKGDFGKNSVLLLEVVCLFYEASKAIAMAQEIFVSAG
jgi:hypothetical protein